MLNGDTYNITIVCVDREEKNGISQDLVSDLMKDPEIKNQHYDKTFS